MQDEREIQNGENGQVGARVCPVSDMCGGVQEGRDSETLSIYGEVGKQMAESISKITGFAYGYPKRIIISMGEKDADGWQKWFDYWYEEICRVHHIIPEPKSNAML